MAGSGDGQEEKTVNLKVFQGIPQNPHDETNPCLASSSNSPCTSTSASESVQPLSQADVNESEGQTPNLETRAKRKRTEDEPSLDRQAKRRKIYLQFKGVVSQAPDRWGAQIYRDGNRVWLGTFKSEKEAAKAYDRACIKLLSKNGTRNLPNEPIIEIESLFQDQFSWQEVATMIKEHSYDDKLHNWRNDNFNPKQLLQIVTEGPMLDREHLFDKQVTVSDVGKLNRLVIPKRHAEHYFPENKLEDFLKFVDSDDKEWKFRYSFWSSSQSYVLTRGWRKFVKAKDLQEGDMISFSRESMTTELKFYISVNKSQNFRCHSSLNIQSSSYSIPGAGGLSAIPISVKMPLEPSGSETTELLDCPKEDNDVIISKESPPQEKNYLSLPGADELNLGLVSFHESQRSSTSNFNRLFGCGIYPEDQNQKEEDLELKL